MVRFVMFFFAFLVLTFSAQAEETCNDGADCVGRCESRAFTSTFCCSADGPGFWGRNQDGDPISCEEWAEWNLRAREKKRKEFEELTKSSCSISDVTDTDGKCHRLECRDGTAAEWCDGIDGVDGSNGQDGKSCTVHQTMRGATIECQDGTRAVVRNGRDAPPQSIVHISPLVGTGYRLVGGNTSIQNVYAGIQLGVYDFRTAVTVGALMGLAGDGSETSRKIGGEVSWLLGYAREAFGIYLVARWTQSGPDAAWSWDIRGIAIDARAEFRPLALSRSTSAYAGLFTLYGEGGVNPNIAPGMSFKDASVLSLFEFGLQVEYKF